MLYMRLDKKVQVLEVKNSPRRQYKWNILAIVVISTFPVGSLFAIWAAYQISRCGF